MNFSTNQCHLLIGKKQFSKKLKHKKIIAKQFILGSLLLLLYSCGGGSNTTTPPASGSAPPPPAPTNQLPGPRPTFGSRDYVLFESGQVRPLAISSDATRLYATNTLDNRLEIFSISNAGLEHLFSVPVGMEPLPVKESIAPQ